MTFKGFNDIKLILDRSQYFDMLEGEKTSDMLPVSWKKSIVNGIVIPVKMKCCSECRDKIFCDECNNQVDEYKTFEANLNSIKRDVPSQVGHMLPYYILLILLKRIFLF